MSVNSVEPVASIPQGHVRLILLSVNDSLFYLQIPLDIISSLCLKPRKYLVFLGWCILGVEGRLARENDGHGIATTGALEDQGIYYYVTDDVGGKFSCKLLLSSYKILMICYLFNEELTTALGYPWEQIWLQKVKRLDAIRTPNLQNGQNESGHEPPNFGKFSSNIYRDNQGSLSRS